MSITIRWPYASASTLHIGGCQIRQAPLEEIGSWRLRQGFFTISMSEPLHRAAERFSRDAVRLLILQAVLRSFREVRNFLLQQEPQE